MKIEKKVHTNKLAQRILELGPNKLAQKIASKTKEREIHNEKEIKVPQIKKYIEQNIFLYMILTPLYTNSSFIPDLVYIYIYEK